MNSSGMERFRKCATFFSIGHLLVFAMAAGQDIAAKGCGRAFDLPRGRARILSSHTLWLCRARLPSVRAASLTAIEAHRSFGEGSTAGRGMALRSGTFSSDAHKKRPIRDGSGISAVYTPLDAAHPHADSLKGQPGCCGALAIVDTPNACAPETPSPKLDTTGHIQRSLGHRFHRKNLHLTCQLFFPVGAKGAYGESLCIGKQIRASFLSLKKKDYIEFLSNLGPGIAAKKAALCEIIKTPEEYSYLQEISDWSSALVSQTVCFITEVSPPEFDLAHFDSTATRYIHPFGSNAQVCFSLKSHSNHREIGKNLDVLKSLDLSKKDQRLSGALWSFFNVPEILRDFSEFKMGFLASLKKKHKKLHAGCSLEKHLHKPKDISDFFGALECLSGIARSICARAEEDIGATRKECTGMAKKLKKHLEQLAFSGEQHRQPADHSSAKNAIESLFRVTLAFYSVYQNSVEGIPIEGSRVFFPEQIYLSIFSVEKDPGKVGYCQVTAEPNDKQSKAWEGSACEKPTLQHVYYIDNEAQARKPVIVPWAVSGIPCEEIAKYIADMYNRPQSQIHLFLFDSEMHSLAHMDPSSTTYFGANKFSKKILVFYYISNNPTENAKLRLVEFRPREDNAPGAERSRVCFPLFLNDLMFRLIDHSGHMFQKTGPEKAAGFVESLEGMVITAYVLVPPPGRPQGYYPLAVIDLESDPWDFEMGYAASSIQVSPTSASGACYSIAYKTRKVRSEPCYTVFIGENAGCILKQSTYEEEGAESALDRPADPHKAKHAAARAPSCSPSQYEPGAHPSLAQGCIKQGVENLSNLFWHVEKSSIKKCIVMSLLSAKQCNQLGLRGDLLRLLMK
ncbi:uncharacterized protein NEMAJ01_2020 [Nematocida major]|uniref:uncharacterized protein n=1 Tax=Nematocida major TaxID=1912982 RepID=UPI002007975B|nr:uncharacterized protein NEMAJ01_2020 [Nematocida major]KAH9387124.1 hypothetical protein NEMAJ01_2020 [Nematocida major]